ncbi:hypothetical protein K501DRAFT_43393 [Backusella circina FSU 941]|nr:hypothetical protein K501DRAFT_43393 [Backusella circina FSU 941]
MHMDCEETFSLYSSFISAWKSDANYEETMIRANKIYAKTKAEAEKRDWYEMELINTGYALDTFYQYIEKEKELKPQLNYIRSLYERAIAVYCTDQVLWNDYILYLMERAHVLSFLKALALRAIRNCPWSGMMRAHLARFMESNHDERDDIIDVFDEAVQNKLLLSSMEDLITILLAKCDYERRQIDWSDPDDEQVLNLQVAFHEALQYLEEAFPGQTDPYYRIEKYFAFIQDKRLGNTDDARTLWETIIKKHGKDTEAYIQYIYFERDHGDYEKCASLFKLGLQKRVDNPARLVDVWSTIEREGGTVESMEECLVRSNRVSKFMQHKWQAQSVQMEERVEKEVKKKEVDKKGLRRMEAKKKMQVKKAQNKQTDESMETESSTKEIKPKPSSDEKEPAKTEDTSSRSGLKRKASADLAVLEKKQRNESPPTESPKMDGEFRRPELPFRPGRGNRGALNPRSSRLGRGVLGGGRGGMFVPPKRRETKNEQSDQGSSDKSSEGQQNANIPKSNDDFRSMLLGKK